MRSMARVEGVGFYRCRQAWCAGLVRLLAGVTMCVLLGSAGAAAEVTVLTATEYGLQADGVHDDGPAIRRLLAAVAAAAGPVRAVFPAGRTIRVATGTERYVFALDRASRLTLDGGGSTFLLTPDLRFLRLTHSEQITLCRLNIDVAPLPFVDGTVVAVAAAQRTLDVQTSPGEALRALGGPTHADGEQAFFGMLWQEGAYGLLGRHYWIERMEAGSGPGRVRVTATSAFSEFADIVPGAWRISLPVPGNAHRYGPGACLDISDNDTVTLEDVEVWSAPWFGVEVIRNRGHVTFRRVHIRPPPGSGRLTSTWRDGFHVKGNSATLLWEDCILAGMNDDAFNISTHCSSVQERVTPTRLVVLQTFPLGPMPWHEGNTLAAADFASRTRLGSARIVGVSGWTTERRLDGKPAVSAVTLDLDRPIAGLEVGAMVWEPETTNPDTTLRRCTILNSCRLQSSVTLEACRVTALLWFYGERVEGPFPSRVVVRDSELRRGRGNPRLAISVAGREEGATRPSAIEEVVFERNQIWGDVAITGVDRVRLLDNQFREVGADLRLENCPDLQTSGPPLPPPPGPRR
jgi:hypothetical protein